MFWQDLDIYLDWIDHIILIKPIPLGFSKDSSFLDNDIISY